jgi:peptidoglycan/LPS O-acetylase OafA/YrhL
VTSPAINSSRQSTRDAALDVVRGIAICEVVVHHVLGFARLHAHPDTLSNLLYTAANRTLHFAVPAFLFVMAIVLTRSMGNARWSWPVFYGRRGQQTAIPYLVWSVLYAGFAFWQGKVGEEAVGSPGVWAHWLLWGKAWEHLYFLTLAIQMFLVLPLLVAWVRRWKAGLGALLAAAAGLQLGAYWSHHWWIRSPYPTSLLIWHLVPVIAGVWLGLHLESWDREWRRFRVVFITLAVVGWAAYLPQGIRELKGLPVQPFAYQAAFWVYTTGIVFCLMALGRRIVRSSATWLGRGLQHLGARSMPIYLLHPMLLYFWYRTVPSGTTLVLLLMVLTAVTVALAIPLVAFGVARRSGVALLLFGREDTPLAPLRGGVLQGAAANDRTE